MVHTPQPETPELCQAQLVAASFGRVFEKPIASDTPIPKFPLEEEVAALPSSEHQWWKALGCSRTCLLKESRIFMWIKTTRRRC